MKKTNIKTTVHTNYARALLSNTASCESLEQQQDQSNLTDLAILNPENMEEK